MHDKVIPEFKTITYAMPKRTWSGGARKNNKFAGMQIDVLHPRVFSFPEGADLKRAKHNMYQSAQGYGRKEDQKFRLEIIEYEGSEVIAVWRTA